MFDDLSGVLPDTDLLDAVADIDLGDGLVSAHDVGVINDVLGSSMQDPQVDFGNLPPEVTAVLGEALGIGVDPLAVASVDASHFDFVDPFGDVVPVGPQDMWTVTEATDGVYNAAQAVFSETGAGTTAGFSFLAEGDPAAALDVPTFPGEYALVTHGTPTSVAVSGAELSAEEFAEVVRFETDWNGENIRLVSCDTGQEADGFAQQLANQLGVEVTAPNEVVWVTPNGTIVGDNVFDPAIGHLPPTPSSGEWVSFIPQAV